MKLRSLSLIGLLSLTAVFLFACTGGSAMTYNDSLVETMEKDIIAFEAFTDEEDVDTAYDNYLASLDSILVELDEIGCFKEDCGMYDASVAYITYVKEVISTRWETDFDSATDTALFDNLASAQATFAAENGFELE